jgi:radical SAM superfamily enzyme YgiQ (UPF0313 family)
MQSMRVKFILPALVEASGTSWRPIKYSLFPPLGLATLAACLSPYDEAVIVDEHVEPLRVDDEPDLVAIQVYITNAHRAYAIADDYRARGSYVVLGGLHVTSLPEEAMGHADSIFLGPAEHSFREFLRDLAGGTPKERYESPVRTLEFVPPPRRDLIRRGLYLVPNSIVVSRGCPHHCEFCYKDSFFRGGQPFYTRRVDAALAEIDSLPGRHLYFLDDHLFAEPVFAATLFDGMRGMNRVFQGAGTVRSILSGDVVEHAARAGLRSLFVGFETLGAASLSESRKYQDPHTDYARAIRRLDDLGIMINGSFVFGFDGDDKDVFRRTVDWAVAQGITTATFHILTPYPGTALYTRLERQGRIGSHNWDLYDTRHVVFEPRGMSAEELRAGYDWARRHFYDWRSIARAARAHALIGQQAKHLIYSAAWKKFEPAWNLAIRAKRLPLARPMLETVLSRVHARCQQRRSDAPVASPRSILSQNPSSTVQSSHWADRRPSAVGWSTR